MDVSCYCAIVKAYRARFPLDPSVARVRFFESPETPDKPFESHYPLDASPMLSLGVMVNDKLFYWKSYASGATEAKGYGVLYNPSTNKWMPASRKNQPRERNWAYVKSSGGKILVWGGYFSSRDHYYFVEDGGIYDEKTDSWEKVPVPIGESWAERFPALIGGDSVFLFHRDRKNEKGFPIVSEKYDSHQKAWTHSTSLEGTRCEKVIGVKAVETPSQSLVVVFCEEQATKDRIAFGHYKQHDGREIHSYYFDARAETWIRQEVDCNFPRWICSNTLFEEYDTGLSVTSANGGLYLYAMTYQFNHLTEKNSRPNLLFLDLKTLTIKPIEMAQYSPALSRTEYRGSYQIEWDGKKLLFFGGGSSGFPIHKYEPKSQKWDVMTLPDRNLILRPDKNMFWTGESLIVIGNLGEGQPRNFMIEP